MCKISQLKVNKTYIFTERVHWFLKPKYTVELVKCKDCGSERTVFCYSWTLFRSLFVQQEEGKKGRGGMYGSIEKPDSFYWFGVWPGLWSKGGGCALAKSPSKRHLFLNRGIAGGLCLCQLLFHSLLRPPPIYIRFLICCSVPQSPPTINTTDTKPHAIPLPLFRVFQPDLTQYTLPCARMEYFAAGSLLHH